MIFAPIATTVLLMQSTDIKSYVQSNFDDAHFFAKVGTANFNELKKINLDFSQSYRFKSSEVWIKEPFKLKMETTVEDVKITFVVNGTKKSTKIPDRRISLSDDVSTAPGKRQTLFDFGMMSSALFTNLFDSKFVRMDRATGNAVFDLTYPSSMKDTSRHRVWIDADKKIITKREWYGQLKLRDGRLMATFKYDNAQKFGSVWVATKVSVYNADNALAGVMNFSNMRVNTGLNDSLFKL